MTIVKVYGSTSEYLSKVKAIFDVIKKHEPRAEPRLYQAAFSGTKYGEIHISTRYPSFAALAAANPKIVNDPEHHRAVAALAVAGSVGHAEREALQSKLTVAHHEQDVLEDPEIFQRIARHDDHVSLEALGNPPGPIVDPQQFR